MEKIIGLNTITPVISSDSFWFKRDDLFEATKGFRGTKARTCMLQAIGKPGLTTLHTIKSPQGPLVSAAAEFLSIPCRIHTTEAAIKHSPGELHGAPDVIIHPDDFDLGEAVQADAYITGFKAMARDMDCSEARESIITQCANFPGSTRRVVVPAVTGATAVAILDGLDKWDIDANLMVLCFGKTSEAIRMFEMFGTDWEERTTFASARKAEGKHWFDVNRDQVHSGDLIWMGSTLEGE